MAKYGAQFNMDERATRLLGAINANEESSYGSDTDGELADQRALNINRYLGRNITPAPDGRSQVRDRSVYETVQEMMPSLSRIFANGDDVVELPPIGEEDMQGAEQEAQYLNHILLQKNNWFEIFDTAAKDALITKAGYLHPYVEKRRQIEIEKYERQTPESLALLMEDNPEIIGHKEYPDPDYKPSPQPMLGPDGQPMLGPNGPMMQPDPGPPMLYDVEIRGTKMERKYCIDVFPPERCKIAESTKTVQLQDCAYFEFHDFPTISSLREQGLQIDDDVGSVDSSDTLEDTARNQFQEQSWDDANTLDPAMKRVKCRWVWVRHDYDEDGIAELQYCIVVGSQILFREEVSRIPVAVLCPDKLPHRHVGTCPADAAGEVEDINTAILRQGLDNLYLSNNPVKYADGKLVNLDDVMISRPGATWRLKPGAVMGQNFGVIPIPFVFPQAVEALGYMEHVKEKRTGVNNSFQGLDASQLSQLQPGTVNQISSMAAQRVEQIARHFANGITELMSLLHEVVLKSGHKKEVVQLRGKWVTVDPSTWRKRTDFRISVGFSAGNKDAQIARLQMIGNMQKEAMMGGLSIVNERNVYETMNELIKASDLQAPQRFLTDPEKAQPKPPPQPDITVMAMEQIKTQSAEKIKGAELQSEEKIKAHEIDAARQKAELDAQTKLTIAQMQANHAREIEQVKGSHAKELEGMRSAQSVKMHKMEHGEPAADVDERMAEVGQSVQGLQQQLAATVEQLQQAIHTIVNAKRTIRRGKDGRAEGVDTHGPDGSLISSKKVLRGPDGRVIGSQ